MTFIAQPLPKTNNLGDTCERAQKALRGKRKIGAAIEILRSDRCRVSRCHCFASLRRPRSHSCRGNGVGNTYVHQKGTLDMGKYVLGWILGVPVLVLVLFYLFFH
jgi:hypothetical protein